MISPLIILVAVGGVSNTLVLIGNFRVIKGQSSNSDQEEKVGDLLNGNGIINLYNLITNIDKVLVCKECAQERELQIKLEEKIDVENFIDYVEAYFLLTPSDEQKGIRDLHQNFKN